MSCSVRTLSQGRYPEEVRPFANEVTLKLALIHAIIAYLNSGDYSKFLRIGAKTQILYMYANKGFY